MTLVDLNVVLYAVNTGAALDQSRASTVMIMERGAIGRNISDIAIVSLRAAKGSRAT